MIGTGTILLLGAATLLFYILVLRKPKWKNAPPGPPGLPLVGNTFQIQPEQHLSYTKLAKEYGPIYKLDFFGTPMVVVSDIKMLKDMLSETVFSGRFDFSDFDWIQDGKVHGIANSEGEHWEEMRRFTLRQLRDLGFGKNSMEESILFEVQEFIEILKNDEGKPIPNIKTRTLLAVVNSLWMLLSGKRFKQDDPTLLEFTVKLNEGFQESFAGGVLVLFFPWLGKMFPKWSGYSKLLESIEVGKNFFGPEIEQHKRTIAEDYDRDFIDVSLREIKNTTDPNSAFYGKLGYENLLANVADLYFAGTDTTSSTLAWLFLYLAKHPEVQKKMQEEIGAVTGNNRACILTDRPSMPYTEATLQEVHRTASITPQAIGHCAMEDKEFQGYFIPKGTIITPNVYHIHNDPAIWGDPENFRPERFLSPDGKTFKKHEAVIPFSIGRRLCPGETLARDTLFLFTTNIFQRFWIEFDKNGPDNGYDSLVGFILSPKPFNIILKDRQN